MRTPWRSAIRDGFWIEQKTTTSEPGFVSSTPARALVRLLLFLFSLHLMKRPNEYAELADAVVDILSDDFELSEEISGRIRSKVSTILQERSRGTITPPELAAELRVSCDKILYWIHAGELKATNIAQDQSSRPRYRIDRSAVDDFKRLRMNHAAPKMPRRQKRKPPADVIEFF